MLRNLLTNTVQKVKFSIKDFFRKCDQVHTFLWIWSHLLKQHVGIQPNVNNAYVILGRNDLCITVQLIRPKKKFDATILYFFMFMQ